MEERVCFCRFTQLSLLRLLTTQAIMGTDEVMTQAQPGPTPILRPLPQSPIFVFHFRPWISRKD